ncbi:APC family permease [Sediminibacter sp. Hel_I_10]|uniref:APC family permease n=1 Tax=Sediminibacter sp. Hel_I_10 TaxID=1392490 RepID=UPI00047955D8|nr:APC family permease [Sediminibacter sp. Hel_I_10]
MGNDKIKLKDAMAIGIGGMVGGGIFAVLGLAVSLSKGATPVAFLFAGIVAFITSYSYVKLTLTYPDKGGTVKYINEGFGKTIFSGGINNLLWVSYIIMLSLYASAFGSYAPNLFDITGSQTIDTHIYSSAIVILATLINYYSIKVVSRIESYSVAIKLIILIAFIGIGIYGLFGNANTSQLMVSNWESPMQILTAGMVIFVAYEGFELIANSGSDLINPKKNIPKAYYYSIGFVILLYIIISIVTVGSLSFDTIKSSQEYVLAEASKPMLGQAGFTVMTIAALISTFSAINASLYGGSRVSYVIAEDDELPHELTSQLWNQPIGLIITAVATLTLVNLLNLESISTAGSVGFLIVFSAVNYTGFKIHDKIGANRWVPLFGFVLCIISLVVLIFQQFKSNPTGVIVALSIVGVCFFVEFIYKHFFNTTEKKPINSK